METQLSHTQTLARGEDSKDITIVKAKESVLTDSQGREYIDFTSGWCVGNLGWDKKELTSAVANFSGPIYVGPQFHYQPREELSRLLVEMAPRNLEMCFRATGGTEAVEIALQAAIAHTGRKRFIGVAGAYHGNSIATLGLVSDSPFFDWGKISAPFNEKCADKVERLLKKKDIAALIMEPIGINLGVVIPEPSFMLAIQELCREHGTLLIMDEVATGFGRTGKMFAIEHFGLEPDILCLAKSLSGGAAAIGATMMSKEVGESLKEEQFPYSTYGWHPMSVAAAIANVNYMKENWHELDENIRSLNEYFLQRFEDMRFKSRPEVRSMGMVFKLDFSNKQYAEKIHQRAMEKGLIITSGISFYPALNLDLETAKQGLDIFEAVI